MCPYLKMSPTFIPPTFIPEPELEFELAGGGINLRSHEPKADGFLVCIYIFPGPVNLQTSPSPEVKLEIQPDEALSIR
jgi:hypothetical protein